MTGAGSTRKPTSKKKYRRVNSRLEVLACRLEGVTIENIELLKHINDHAGRIASLEEASQGKRLDTARIVQVRREIKESYLIAEQDRIERDAAYQMGHEAARDGLPMSFRLYIPMVWRIPWTDGYNDNRARVVAKIKSWAFLPPMQDEGAAFHG
jgi:hypothetical protein